jgi:hypothetical protein
MSRRRGRIQRLLIVVCLIGTGAVVLWWLTRIEPTWWNPPDPRDEQVIALADTAERRLLEEAQELRPPEQAWTIRIREEQVNAWLAARLPAWIAHHGQVTWPDQLGMPQVNFNNDGVTVAVELGADSGRRIVVARFVPNMIDGMLRLQIDMVALGRLALPGAPVNVILDAIRDTVPDTFLDQPDVQVAIRQLFGGESIKPELKLVDDRVVRLTAVKCGHGTLELSCVTLGAVLQPQEKED